MHELSIAGGIIELVSEQAKPQPGMRVETVFLRLGPLSGVNKEALLFAWDLACEETPLANARLAIEDAAVEIRCPGCGSRWMPGDLLDCICPYCGSSGTEVLQGDELVVTAVEIVSAEPSPSS